MITIERKEECSGCEACKNVCPKHCIIMLGDNEGFKYPKVDSKKCIDCGMCERVCPIKNRDKLKVSDKKIYAVKNKNKSIRSSSSSGGVFYEIASWVILNGGIVFGCIMNEGLKAVHVGIEKCEDIGKLQSSKYVQSDISDSFVDVKKNLLTGRLVLFSGTPCQVTGLKNFLGKEYENLILIDVLCHGVPSPQLLSDYIHLMEQKYNGRAVSINFRNKKKGWKRLYIEICFDNGKRHFVFSGYDKYMSMFLNNMSLRPSCYECKFTNDKRSGDITLGDFWGIGKTYPHYDDDKGISLVMVNNDRGIELFNKLKDKFDLFESSFDLASAGQRTLSMPTAKNKNRDAFYREYEKNGLKAAFDKYVPIASKPVQLYYAIMRFGLDVVRKILGKGY